MTDADAPNGAEPKGTPRQATSDPSGVSTVTVTSDEVGAHPATPEDQRLAVTLAMTGASGALYGLRLLQCLLHAGRPVDFMLSEAAQVVVGMETGLALGGKPQRVRRTLLGYLALDEAPLQVFGRDQWTARAASGSGAPKAMVICPCTMGTLAAVANGLSQNLIERAADVMLKERRRLIVVPRETPFSAVHLENMLSLARAGALILPANPGFYHAPKDVMGLVDFIVARVLDHLDIDQTLMPRWGDRSNG